MFCPINFLRDNSSRGRRCSCSSTTVYVADLAHFHEVLCTLRYTVRTFTSQIRPLPNIHFFFSLATLCFFAKRVYFRRQRRFVGAKSIRIHNSLRYLRENTKDHHANCGSRVTRRRSDGPLRRMQMTGQARARQFF